MTVSPRYAHYPDAIDTGLFAPVVHRTNHSADPHAHPGVAIWDADTGAQGGEGVGSMHLECRGLECDGFGIQVGSGCGTGSGTGISTGSSRSSGTGSSTACEGAECDAFGLQLGSNSGTNSGTGSGADSDRGSDLDPGYDDDGEEEEEGVEMSLVKFYVASQGGVDNIFVDHPLFDAGQAGQEPYTGVYTYCGSLSDLDLQARNNILCQAALAAPVLFWQLDEEEGMGGLHPRLAHGVANGVVQYGGAGGTAGRGACKVQGTAPLTAVEALRQRIARLSSTTSTTAAPAGEPSPTTSTATPRGESRPSTRDPLSPNNPWATQPAVTTDRGASTSGRTSGSTDGGASTLGRTSGFTDGGASTLGRTSGSTDEGASTSGHTSGSTGGGASTSGRTSGASDDTSGGSPRGSLVNDLVSRFRSHGAGGESSDAPVVFIGNDWPTGVLPLWLNTLKDIESEEALHTAASEQLPPQVPESETCSTSLLKSAPLSSRSAGGGSASSGRLRPAASRHPMDGPPLPSTSSEPKKASTHTEASPTTSLEPKQASMEADAYHTTSSEPKQASMEADAYPTTSSEPKQASMEADASPTISLEPKQASMEADAYHTTSSEPKQASMEADAYPTTSSEPKQASMEADAYPTTLSEPKQASMEADACTSIPSSMEASSTATAGGLAQQDLNAQPSPTSLGPQASTSCADPWSGGLAQQGLNDQPSPTSLGPETSTSCADPWSRGLAQQGLNDQPSPTSLGPQASISGSDPWSGGLAQQGLNDQLSPTSLGPQASTSGSDPWSGGLAQQGLNDQPFPASLGPETSTSGADPWSSSGTAGGLAQQDLNGQPSSTSSEPQATTSGTDPCFTSGVSPATLTHTPSPTPTAPEPEPPPDNMVSRQIRLFQRRISRSLKSAKFVLAVHNFGFQDDGIKQDVQLASELDDELALIERQRSNRQPQQLGWLQAAMQASDMNVTDDGIKQDVQLASELDDELALIERQRSNRQPQKLGWLQAAMLASDMNVTDGGIKQDVQLASELDDELALIERQRSNRQPQKLGWLQAAMLASDMNVTVSPTYAREIVASAARVIAEEELVSLRNAGKVVEEKDLDAARNAGKVVEDNDLDAGSGGTLLLACGAQNNGELSSLPLARGLPAKGILGLLNGIDDKIWDPSTDPHLPKKLRYSLCNVASGKRQAKALLQRRLGLKHDPDTPLFGFVGRLEEQKGVDVLLSSFPILFGPPATAIYNRQTSSSPLSSVTLVQADSLAGQTGGADVADRSLMQVVALGTGAPWAEEAFAELSTAYPGRAVGLPLWNETLAHLMMAACDYLIVPSRYEPCGLVALCGLRYGTVPLVAPVGGLKDIVNLWGPGSGIDSETGSEDRTASSARLGFTMASPVGAEGQSLELRRAAADLAATVDRAVQFYGTQEQEAMRARCMEQDVSWSGLTVQWETALTNLFLVSSSNEDS
eukprot:gene27391-4691_t